MEVDYIEETFIGIHRKPKLTIDSKTKRVTLKIPNGSKVVDIKRLKSLTVKIVLLWTPNEYVMRGKFFTHEDGTYGVFMTCKSTDERIYYEEG